MNRKIISITAATIFLSSSVFAGDRYLGAGYANINDDESSTNGIGLNMRLQFGDMIKNAIGVEYFVSENNNDINDSKGNTVNVYYNLGYKVISNTNLYGSIGYGGQSIGSYGAGSSQVKDVMATGMSFGAGINYSLNNSFDIDVSYKQFNLSYLDIDYTLNVTNIGLAYKY